jgi:hypothetical protein
MKWITRASVKVDGIACPWLIKKFVDRDAEFFFVPAEQVQTDLLFIPELQENRRRVRAGGDLGSCFLTCCFVPARWSARNEPTFLPG